MLVNRCMPGANRENTMAPKTELSEVEARQGVTLGRMRYVLAVSLSLAVLAMIVAIRAA
jgi:hypothetical protein